MEVTETLSEGLKREFKVVVPASEMDSRLLARLEKLKDTAQIKGFRPGKVPVGHLRRLVGRQNMSEIVQEVLREQTNEILTQRGERSAQQPNYDLPEDEKEAEKVLDGKADFEFSIRYEVLPKVALGDFKSISVERPVVDVPLEEVDAGLARLAQSNATFSEKKGKAGEGDRVTIDYVGKLGDEAFDGGADQDAQIVVGSKQFIPGFEEQLVGVAAGDEKTLKVSFPADYGAANLAGQEASFDVKVKDVAAADSLAVDDALAQKLGLESLEKLRAAVEQQLDGQNGPLVRQRVKRQLLDSLDDLHKFEPPPSMVEQEFDAVWQDVVSEMEQSGKSFEDEDSNEEALRDYYRGIADRRVRLGLVLAEIGESNKIDVTDAELQRALSDEVRQNPGREKEITEFYQSNAAAVSRLRAPLFEEKVVDFLLELVNVTDKPVTRPELIALVEADEADAGPGELAET